MAGFALLLAGLAVLLFLLPASGPVQSGRTIWIALALALLFAAADSSLIHVDVRQQTFTISLSEFPLALGLFLLPPIWLISARVLAGAGVFLLRRTAQIKVIFNLGLFAAEICAAELVFLSLRPGNGLPPRDWLITCVAVLVVDVMGPAAVIIAMRLLDSRLTRSELLRRLPAVALTGALTGALNVTMALLTLEALRLDKAALYLIAILGVVVATAYRAYRRLLRQHADLGQLFAFTQTVGAAETRDDMVAELLKQAGELLQAEISVLRLPPAEVANSATITSVEPALPLEPVVIPSGTRDPLLRAWLTQTGLRDALLVPLFDDGGVIGVLQVANRSGVGTFSARDLQLLQTLSAHAEVIRHNGALLGQLRYDAQHDALTGLANRSLFLTRLDEQLATCAAPGLDDEQLSAATDPANVEAAVLLLDLDRFKEVNDTLGHHVGDLLLCQVAARLEATLPAGALVSRLGGDEFAVLLGQCHSAGDAYDAAVTVRQAFAGAFAVAGTALEVGASVGIALIPTDGRRSAFVLQHADVAMYAAKRASTGVARYQRGDDQSSLSRLALAGELRYAIEAGELIIHYQPQMDLTDDRIIGYEALVRWNHPRRGLLPPDEFIDVAEQTGLIGALTREVLRQALHQCQVWVTDDPDIRMAVNLSARGLLEQGLPTYVSEVLAQAGLPAEMLTLEITESSVMGDFEAALAALEHLHALGVRLSVDDFGTGYSSLAYLQRLPVDEVKIDKSFIIPMSVSPNAAAIVRAIVDLAHTMNLTVVAEGVEDERSRHALVSMGCDTMQGFLLSRPLRPEDVAPWRDAHARHAAVGRPARLRRVDSSTGVRRIERL